MKLEFSLNVPTFLIIRPYLFGKIGYGISLIHSDRLGNSIILLGSLITFAIYLA